MAKEILMEELVNKDEEWKQIKEQKWQNKQYNSN
jgi:hypothetical protein